jgi:hypothetical protein
MGKDVSYEVFYVRYTWMVISRFILRYELVWLLLGLDGKSDPQAYAGISHVFTKTKYCSESLYVLCLPINATSLLLSDVRERQTPGSLSESTRLTSKPGTGYPDRRCFVLLRLSMWTLSWYLNTPPPLLISFHIVAYRPVARQWPRNKQRDNSRC